MNSLDGTSTSIFPANEGIKMSLPNEPFEQKHSTPQISPLSSPPTQSTPSTPSSTK